MLVREVMAGVRILATLDYDRALFDELIPLPDGTSYNAYLIEGEDKTVLIDSTYNPFRNELISELKRMGISKLDYVVANHAEADHSGAIPAVLEAYPNAMVLASEKCVEFLHDMLLVERDRMQAVSDGETIDIGGKKLQFISAPWVHWPETILTYLQEHRALFTCDLFGSHLATTDIYAKSPEEIEKPAKRYYAEIMMPFRSIIQRHLQKIRGMDVKLIAPSHGPIYLDPSIILNLYEDWVSDRVKNEVVIAYVSMYGSTLKLVERLTNRLGDYGIVVKRFNLPHRDIGELVMALVDAATVVLAAPTVLSGVHPAAIYGAYLIGALRPKTKYFAFMGSYGWGTRVLDQVKELLGGMRAEMLEPVLVKGHPREGDYRAADRLAETIYSKHRELGIA